MDVATAHDGLVNNNWKVATLTDYLRVNGLNDKAVQSIKKCAILSVRNIKVQNKCTLKMHHHQNFWS
jgi:hypothetical protein